MGEGLKITEKELARFRSLGIIDEFEVRNIHLKMEYRKRIKKEPDKKKHIIRQELLDNYNEGGHNEILTINALEQILFRQSGKKRKRIIIRELL